MSKLIIIRGPLGVGKTTVSKYLAHHIQAEYISVDQVLKANDLEAKDGYGVEDFLKANEIIILELEKNFDRGVSVVVDGNFYFKQAIDDLVDNVSVDTQVFTLHAPLDICIERDAGRQPPHGKDAAEFVYNAVAKVKYGTVIETADKLTPQVVTELEKLVK